MRFGLVYPSCLSFSTSFVSIHTPPSFLSAVLLEIDSPVDGLSDGEKRETAGRDRTRRLGWTA